MNTLDSTPATEQKQESFEISKNPQTPNINKKNKIKKINSTRVFSIVSIIFLSFLSIIVISIFGFFVLKSRNIDLISNSLNTEFSILSELINNKLNDIQKVTELKNKEMSHHFNDLINDLRHHSSGPSEVNYFVNVNFEKLTQSNPNYHFHFFYQSKTGNIFNKSNLSLDSVHYVIEREKRNNHGIDISNFTNTNLSNSVIGFFKKDGFSYFIVAQYKVQGFEDINKKMLLVGKSFGTAGYTSIISTNTNPISPYLTHTTEYKNNTILLDPFQKEGSLVVDKELQDAIYNYINEKYSEKVIREYGKSEFTINNTKSQIFSYSNENKSQIVSMFYLPHLKWVLIYHYDVDYLNNLVFLHIMQLALLIGVVILICIVIPITNYASKFAAQISEINLKFKKIRDGKGDLTQHVQVSKGNYELGELQKFFNHFMTSLSNTVSHIKYDSHQAYEKLETVVTRTKTLSSETQNTLEVVQAIRKDLLVVGDSVNTSSIDVNLIIENVSQLMNNVSLQKTAIEETQKSIINVTEIVEEHGNLNQDAKNIVKNLRNITEESLETNTNLIGQVKNIQEASNTISSVVEIITHISEQTNLLAMNAAIEAAHAGDYGKGFAVVAEEIRKLAENSTENTGQIFNLINNIINLINDTAVEGEKTVKNLQNMKYIVEEILNINEKIIESNNYQTDSISDMKVKLKNFLSLSEDGIKIINSQQIASEAVKTSFVFLEENSKGFLELSEEREQDIAQSQQTLSKLNFEVEAFKNSMDQLILTTNKFKSTFEDAKKIREKTETFKLNEKDNNSNEI